MKKSELLKQIETEIKIGEGHKCGDRDCQMHALGVVNALRAVRDTLEKGRFPFSSNLLRNALGKYTRETYNKEVEEKFDEQLKKLYFPEQLKLNLLGYRYEGLVLLKKNIVMEALTRNSLELIIDQAIWEEMIQIYAKSNVIGMAVVIFKEYEQGVKIVHQYINYKLEHNAYEDLKSQLQAKYDL